MDIVLRIAAFLFVLAAVIATAAFVWFLFMWTAILSEMLS